MALSGTLMLLCLVIDTKLVKERLLGGTTNQISRLTRAHVLLLKEKFNH